VARAEVSLFVADWRALADELALLNAANVARDSALSACTTNDVATVAIEINSRGFDPSSMRDEKPIVGVSWLRDGGWHAGIGMKWPTDAIKHIASLIEDENRRAALEKQKSAALADCGAEPAISGGPWFSSTYKVAARDAARSGFLCVKTVEYISAAPNPFGGNAARARFVGYQARYEPQRGAFGLAVGQEMSTYELTSEVRDFPY
jgi:hypothetical protein